MTVNVVLGVSGGIAAYKACELLRLFTESGHHVRVVPTASALRFVGAPTWAALSGQPVAEDVLVAKLEAISQNGYDQRIFVRGDKSVDYGRVMEVMGMLSQAGFTHIGLVTDVAKPKPDTQ